ncbi:MAG: hypothetical protein QNJ16_07000 [Rhodobacter sp.]|nr:hypothetical protein [Rhodobacter sp.]
MESRGTVATYRPSFEEVMAGPPQTEAERKLLAACKTGEPVILGDEVPEELSEATSIRAGLIRYLLLGGCDKQRPHPKGIRVMGAWIDGELDFEGCETRLDLRLFGSNFADRPVLQGARLGGLYLKGSRCHAGLNLHRLVTDTSVHLSDGFHCAGLVNLGGVRIGGQLSCKGGRFDGAAGGVALDGDSLSVAGSVLLNEGFHASGMVDLGRARIGGQLTCVGGRFEALLDGVALNGNALTVGTDVFLANSFHATGQVNLVGAQIGGQLACIGGRFEVFPDGIALDGDALTVEADVFLAEGFRATGSINLRGAKIKGQLACIGGHIEVQEDAVALHADALSIGTDVFFRADGQARTSYVSGRLEFVRAKIGGNLQFLGAEIEGDVDLESARIGEGLFWQGVQGQVGTFDLTETKASVLRDDSYSWGKVTTPILTGFRFDRLESGMALRQRLKILERKNERLVSPAVGEEVEVRGIKLKRPPPWIPGAYTDDFDPQPYTQLAKVLDAQGNRSGAARTLVVREHKLRKAAWRRARAQVDGSWSAGLYSTLADLGRIWGFFFRWVFGYGHAPARALLWVVGIWVFGAGLYGASYHAGQMAPNSDVVLTSADWVAGVKAFDACTAECIHPLRAWEQTASYQDYETFSATLYGLDLFIPLDALGQEAAWAPSKDRGWLGWLGYWLRAPIQMAGWIITAVAAAVLTGLIGRKD